jgi:predicted dehydrogenase
MAELGIGLLGSGYMGMTYAESIQKYNTRGRLVAISGGTRAPGLAEKHGVPYEPTYEGMLARPDLDAVLIATPHTAHLSQVVAAAEAGKHVLVEKPMSTNVADCTTMIEACRKAGVRLQVIQTLRFRGTLKRAKEQIEQGAIGEMRMMSGRSLFGGYVADEKHWAAQPDEGGAYLDMGVHNFDIMRFLTGSEPKRIFSWYTSYDAPLHQGLNAMHEVVFQNGVVCQQWMSYQMPSPNLPDSGHRYWVVGSEGILDIDGYGKLLLGRDGKWELIWEQPAIDFVNRPLEATRLEAFFTQTQAFIDDVLDNKPDTVSGEDGRAAVAMVEAGRRSAHTGQAVEM